MTVRIRCAEERDIETIARFNRRLAEDSGDKLPDLDVLRRGVRRALTCPSLATYYLAEQEAQVIGQAMTTFELSDWRDGLVWWFQSVFVVPERRGEGVFLKLYRHIEAAARADPDARGLRLYVLNENTRAQRAYLRAGMEPSRYRVFETDWSLAERDP